MSPVNMLQFALENNTLFHFKRLYKLAMKDLCMFRPFVLYLFILFHSHFIKHWHCTMKAHANELVLQRGHSIKLQRFFFLNNQNAQI